MLIDLCYSFNTCISLHILHTVLYAYPYVLIRRLYLTINRSLNIRFGGGGGLLDVGHLRVWMGIAMVSDKNIFGADQFIQSDLLKCLSWFPYFPNLDEKVPEWSNIFVQWLSQWQIGSTFLEIHTDWRLIWLWALNRVWLKIIDSEYKSSN